MSTLGAISQNAGIIFSWVILLPGVATVLVIVAKVAANGEKAEDQELAGRWGPGARPTETD